MTEALPPFDIPWFIWEQILLRQPHCIFRLDNFDPYQA